jgi:pentatricopeptide repeat protein
MYANCGELSRAHEALKELPLRDVSAWNALIAGYARRGQAHEALCCLEEMEREGISPDEVTLLSVLNACGHSGLVDQAQIIFTDMTRRYGISPNLRHRTCMVMAFGCGGYFEKAMAMMEAMPSLDDRCLSLWIALLGGCRKWGNVLLGMLAFGGALQVDCGDCAAAYELMAKIFASAGLQADAAKVEAMRWNTAPSCRGTYQSHNPNGFRTRSVKCFVDRSWFETIYRDRLCILSYEDQTICQCHRCG